MLRATIWTVGLFGAGTALVRAFPGTWTEPIVLLALGVALLFASARGARVALPRRAARAAAGSPAPVAAPAPAAVAAPAPVENTA